MQVILDRTTRRSTNATGGGRKTPRGDNRIRAYLILSKKPMSSMVKLAKKMEAMDPRDWNVEGEEFDHTIKQETNSSVITLVANHLYKNDKRPKGMTIREIATSLQFLSKSQIMI